MNIAAHVSAGLAALLAVTSAAHCQTWPDKTITYIVPFAAGGGTDAFARPLLAKLDVQLGVRNLIENRAGAGGTTGATAAARATPDGYTLLIGAAHHTIAPGIYPKLSYDIEKDFIPVAMIARPPHVVVVHPQKVAARNLKDLITFALANPDKLTYGTAGLGTTHHMAGELFKLMSKTKIREVHYRGAGPAMQDLIPGHIDLAFDAMGTSAPPISAGQIIALAVAAPKRVPAFPDIPTSAEAGLPGFEVSTWYAIWAPKGTPADAVKRLTSEVQTALKDPSIKEHWDRNGSEVPDLTGEALGRFVSEEVARWGTVVRDAGVKGEGG